MLVDTHILVWISDDDTRLGPQARARLSNLHPVYYSSMSVFEMVIKKMRGRFRTADRICAELDAEGLRQLPFIGEHAERLTDFPELNRHDSFDRALVAQANAEGLTFLTADRRLLALEHDWIVDARA